MFRSKDAKQANHKVALELAHKDTEPISDGTGAGGISMAECAKQDPSHRARHSLVRVPKQGGPVVRDFLRAKRHMN